jgi:hypothetical protein
MKKPTALSADPEYVKGFEELSLVLGQILKIHLEKEPHTRGKVHQALNALAIHAATILAGCDDDEAIEFFEHCLNNQLKQIEAWKAQPGGDSLS